MEDEDGTIGGDGWGDKCCSGASNFTLLESGSGEMGSGLMRAAVTDTELFVT